MTTVLLRRHPAGEVRPNVVGSTREDMGVPRTAAPLVGRTAELAELSAVLHAAAAGSAGAIVVGGDAGVGKTRLLAELVTTAERDGLRTLVGHCVDLGDTPPPYLPFTEAFTRLAAEDPEAMDDLVSAFPALVRLLPGRGAAADAVLQPDERLERGELFDSVRGALGRLSEHRALALFVEDVHWADQATRDLLGYLFTRLRTERLALVVSYRSDDLHRRHPLRHTLAEWARLPLVSRLALDPLDADQVRTMLRELENAGASTTETAAAVSDEDLESIVSRADGNAFFAEELLAAVVSCAGAQQLPWQLADLLLVRLDRLSDDARQVVRVAAVAGRRVSHPMLEAVAGLPTAQLDTALREALDNQVMQLTSSGRGYTFRHALLAEAVYDDLLPGERVRLHAGYAAALAADPDHRPAELARHASASHDLETAFRASLAAGIEAMALAAPLEAFRHYESALELAVRVPAEMVDRPALVLSAVEAADAAGMTRSAMRLAERALEVLSPEAEPTDRATLVFAAVQAALGHEIDERELERSREAVRLLADAPPSELRARVLTMAGRVALILGRDADAEKHLREAAEVAVAAGSRRAESETRVALAVLERRQGEPAEAARLLGKAASEARAAGDSASEVHSLFSLASLWHELTDLDRAEQTFRQAHRRAVESGRQWEIFGVHARAMTGTLQYIRGEWDDALRTLDTHGERPTTPGEAILRSTGMLIRGARGDDTILAEAEQLRPLWEREGRIGLYAVQGVLEIHERNGDAEPALAAIDELVERLGVLWLNPWFLGRIQLSALGLATLSAAAVHEPKARHAELTAHGARLVADGRTSGEKGQPSTRRMGREGRAWLVRLEAEWARLRWLTGEDPPDADELVALWERTVDEFGFGHQLQLARSRARLAGALRAVGRTAEAADVAETARPVAERLGAVGLLAELKAATGGSAARRADTEARGLSALTERENDVLAELVEGRTNRQIAAKLFISEKTVSVHVSNILAKLGVKSRAEAAAFARRA